jgi:RND family efflux transporter MFP subunit
MRMFQSSKKGIYLLSLMATLLIISCSEDKNKSSSMQPKLVKAIQIENFKSLNGRAFPGKARATQEVNLSFNVNGILTDLPINIGDVVKKGELIAKLDSREFEAKLKSAKAEVERDKQNFQRAKDLIGKGFISQANYDLLKAKLETSEANMDIASKALVDCVINAPFNGKIANLYVKNYQSVSNQQNVARLLDTSQIEMVIQVPESIISLMPFVKNIIVTFDPFPNHPIHAEIKEISNEASPDTRTYPITLIMKQPEGMEILPGMAGKATGRVEKDNIMHEKITIPAAAVMTDVKDKNTYVWVIDDKSHKVHKRQIKIGELTPTGISVLSGLSPGEWLVIAGVNSLDEGQETTILNEKDDT